MPSSTNALWPECYGFSLVGDGPCYVLDVTPGSVAFNSGIVPGDQLLELDGHNVSDMSAEAIKVLARHSVRVPPSVGVVSRLRYVDLVASSRWGHGLSLTPPGTSAPTHVEAVDPPGPAYQAGIRPGDLVLEVNGQPPHSIGSLSSLLTAHYGKLSLAIVPMETRTTGAPRAPSSLHPPTTGSPRTSRVRKARDLFAMMNLLLGKDYEKKMTCVGLLKQYAEDRNVDTFALGLNRLLPLQQHRQLITELRPFIPVKQREQYDNILGNKGTGFPGPTTPIPPERVTSPEPRVVSVERKKGSFGFVLRGHSPVFIESVLPGGPADRAGIQPGDAILKLNGLDVTKSSHSHLVRLLQGSGSKPRLEVQQITDEKLAFYPVSHTSSDSTTGTSHSTLSWLSDGGNITLDGHTFKQKVHHLLTPKEKTAFRTAMINYNRNRNVSEFVDDAGAVLDTPSKRCLWVFLLHRMTTQHKNYVLKYVDIPKRHFQDIESIVDATADKSSFSLESHGEGSSWDDAATQERGRGGGGGSFQQQLDYLLTSRERSQLKKALQIYADRRNIHHLLEDLQDILETPSKKTLWFYIIPLLSSPHQKYAQTQLNLPQHVMKTGHHGHHDEAGAAVRVTGDMTDGNRHLAASPQDGDVLYQHEHFTFRGASTGRRNRGGQRMASSDDDMDDLAPSSSTMSPPLPPRHHHSSHRHGNNGAGGALSSSDSHDDSSTLGGGGGGNQRRGGGGGGAGNQHTAATGTQTYQRANDKKRNQVPVYAEVDKSRFPSTRPKTKLVRESSAQTTPVHSPFKSQPTLPNGDYRTIVHVYDSPQRSPDILSVYHHNVHGAQRPLDASRQRPEVPGQARGESEASTGTSTSYTKGGGGQGGAGKHNGLHTISDADSDLRTVSDNSYESYQAKALNAIKALDEVVANEPSGSMGEGDVPPPPAPPPPPPFIPVAPLPPPLPPTVGAKNGELGRAAMNVKRINWEKIDEPDSQSIWAKIDGSAEELEDVVKYLELEQQFSTKKTKVSESFRDRKSEHYIISPKKAYNISILLGHLRLPMSDIKQALLAMDENVLNPELLRQILAYSPDTKEMESYDAYKGSVDELSKPDQFMYQLSRVPGYDQRLKAMLFKANFAEKVDEVKQNLKCIRKASQELQQSPKLSRILEMVLAMGNYMNKGNTRVGQAAGFRVSFLAQLDLTKTSDGKASFLHVLANAVYKKFPECMVLAEDLPTVPEAAKITSSVSNDAMQQELSDLKKVLQDISATVKKLSNQGQRAGTNDRFHEVMEHFISQASDEIQGLFRLHNSTSEEFHAMVQYFGEDPQKMDTNEIFSIFAEFITKFEKAHTHNMQFNKKFVKEQQNAAAKS